MVMVRCVILVGMCEVAEGVGRTQFDAYQDAWDQMSEMDRAMAIDIGCQAQYYTDYYIEEG